ncbi:hypothetical protein BDW_09050 [Bdellovibrio bacteriovorus W]|nr:hypothetical protein BDW_09050 [Bdellovibrio bacteriovorus W]
MSRREIGKKMSELVKNSQAPLTLCICHGDLEMFFIWFEKAHFREKVRAKIVKLG